MIIHKKTDYKESASHREEMLRQLKNSDLSGSVVLHTCNRVEYYGGAGEVSDSVARHLFRLASGLESVFIGETFIQGQIKEAYQQASAKHSIDASLHRLFQWALLTGKRVRTETGLSRGAMSHSQAVVEIIRNTIGDYKTKRFAFIGVNKINKTIMNFLKDNVYNAFVLCNRTFETAVELEQQFNCKAYTLKNLKESLQQSDIVISATSAPHYIIKPDAIPPDHPLVVFDLAVPRDVDPIVSAMPNVHYYSILEIENQVNQNIAGRTEEVEKANLIMEEEVRRFLKNEKRHQKHLMLIHAQQERSYDLRLPIAIGDYLRLNYLNMTIRLIARKSNLSLVQVEEIKALLPEVEFLVNTLDSIGDKNKQIPLETCDIPDFFTRELDEALLIGKADIAVHSAKDLPYPIPFGLEVIALTAASDQTDSLVSRNNIRLNDLPQNSKIGTSSALRGESIKTLRPDAEIISVRGTIQERIDFIEKGTVDAVVVATCVLNRLGLTSQIAEILPFEMHPLQGHLAVVAKTGNHILKELFKPFDIRQNYGKVFLAGFGPGDPELITVKALRALENADVVYYDDLIEKSFLEDFSAQKIYVGKRKGNHSHSQDQINELLYRSSIAGKNTVRLKGGDPFIFGRGGEEFEYLHKRLIEPVVIPGITAAVGAAAQTGIPLTNRGESSSVAFITASSLKEIEVPQVDTLVYYMGASNLKQLREKVLQKGVSPETSAAIITNATLPGAKLSVSTLRDLPDETASPSIIIIGKTIKNRNIMKPQPNVLVTGLSAEQYQHLGNVTHQPLIEIVPIEMPCDFFKFIKYIYNYKYIVFTSRNAVHHFMHWLSDVGSDAKALESGFIVSIGAVTTAELQKHGITPHLTPAIDSSTGIIKLFRSKGITGEEVLIPRSDIALNILPDGLRALGNNVHVITVYYTQPVTKLEKVDLKKYDILVFTSPSGVKSFLKHYGEVPYHIKVITRGEQTQEAYERNSALYI